MAVHFQLWDTVTANLIATFATEAEALTFIREVIEDGQRDLVEGWALGCQDRRGRGRQLAAGPELADRAVAHITA